MKKSISVVFDKSFEQSLEKWKKKCLSSLGYGGIKKRLTQLIKEDLENGN